MAAYNDVGKAQEVSGRVGEAVDTLRKALAMGEAIARDDPANLGLQEDLSWSHGRLADALLEAGDAQGALDHYGRAVEAMRVLSPPGAPANPYREYLAWWERKTAGAHERRARQLGGEAAYDSWREARECYRRAEEVLRGVRPVRPLSNWAEEMPAEVSAGLARCERALRGRRPR